MNRTFFRTATFIAAFSVILVSCDTLPTGPAVIGGFYTYRAFNTSDSLVVTGTIVLRNSVTTILTGTWDLHGAGNGGQSGPQTGRGTLTGSTDGGVSMNLNPSMADNNVILSGSVRPQRNHRHVAMDHVRRGERRWPVHDEEVVAPRRPGSGRTLPP